MNNKKIIFNKLFPLTPSKSYHNLMIDDEAVSYITTPNNSEIISAIIDSHIPNHIARSDITVFDGTACVGGDTIAFGKIFGTVVATEIDEMRYNMLSNNLLEFELYNVVTINSDCIKLYKRINYIDIMYFDPPWGGRRYKTETDLRLMIGDTYIDELVDSVFEDANLMKSNVQIVTLKLPKNYDLKILYDNIKHHPITIYLYELQKMNIVVVKKNDAWS